MGPETGINHEPVQERPLIFLLLGPEGSGKTTQAKVLAKSLGLPFFSTGDTLRAIDSNLNDQSERAKRVRQMFVDHVYLDAKTLQEIMGEKLRVENMSKGFVVDGMLRTLEETEDFPEFLESIGKGNAVLNVISLRIPGWLGVQRNSARARDQHDSSTGSVGRMGKYYADLGRRMSLARKIVADRGGRFEIVDARASDEEEVPSQDELDKYILELNRRIMARLQIYE